MQRRPTIILLVLLLIAVYGQSQFPGARYVNVANWPANLGAATSTLPGANYVNIANFPPLILTGTNLVANQLTTNAITIGFGLTVNNNVFSNTAPTPWTNVSGGISYTGNVAVAGTVTATNGFVAGTNTGSGNAMFYALEQITSHAHYGFLDSSVLNMAASGFFGHASFADNISIQGTNDFDHHHSFQAQGAHTNNGIVTNFVSFFTQPLFYGTGSVLNLYGVGIYDHTGNTNIDNQFGYYVDTLFSGTNNYSVYTKGASDSLFGGNLFVGAQNNLGAIRGILLGDTNSPAKVYYNSASGNLDVYPRSGYITKVFSELELEAANASSSLSLTNSAGPNGWRLVPATPGVANTGLAIVNATGGDVLNVKAQFDQNGTLSVTNGFAVGTKVGISCTNKVILQDLTTNLMVWEKGICVSNIANYHD